jgi:hypothetical protein
MTEIVLPLSCSILLYLPNQSYYSVLIYLFNFKKPFGYTEPDKNNICIFVKVTLQ